MAAKETQLDLNSKLKATHKELNIFVKELKESLLFGVPL